MALVDKRATVSVLQKRSCVVCLLRYSNHIDNATGKQTMQATLNLKIERTETGEFIAYFPGDYHIGYGATASDARDALLWSMENE